MAFYQRISNDLLKATNANALVVPVQLKSAVQDFNKAVREAIASVKAGNAPVKRARKPRTVKAAPVAQPSNGADVTA